MDILTILVFLQCSLDFQLIILNVLLINGSESRNFRFYHDSYQSSPMMNRIKYFQFRWDSLLYVLYSTMKYKFWPCGVKNLVLVSSYFYTSNFLPKWMCSLIKGFYMIIPLRETKDQQRVRFWLFGVPSDSFRLQTLQTSHYDAIRGSDSTAWRTPTSLTLLWDAQRRVLLLLKLLIL